MRELVSSYQDRIFRMAFRVLGDGSRAEEATVDSLAAVWTRSRKWRGDCQAATWIHRIAWSVILDHHRARRSWWRYWELDGSASSVAGADSDPSQIVAEQDEQAALKSRMEGALRRLSPEDRLLIHMHYYEKQSLAEIAVVLSTSRDALKMRLSRLREKLRATLGGQHRIV